MLSGLISDAQDGIDWMKIQLTNHAFLEYLKMTQSVKIGI